jgi:hypothetical protein
MKDTYVEGPGTETTEAIAAGEAREVQATERGEGSEVETVPGEAVVLLLCTLVVGVVRSSVALVTTPKLNHTLVSLHHPTSKATYLASSLSRGQEGKNRDPRSGLHGERMSGLVIARVDIETSDTER